MTAKTANIKRIPRTRSKTLRRISSILSFVFHPLVIVTYLAIALYKIGVNGFSSIPEPVFLKWTGIIFLTTVFLPFLSILVLRLTGLISDAFMHAPKDRVWPMISTLIFYSWAFYFFQLENSSPLLLRLLLLGATFSVLLDFFINFFYKVSVHTTAAAMMPGNILTLVLIHPKTDLLILLTATAAAVLVGLVRWWLGAHTTGQILLGYGIGISMPLIAYLVLR